jgi:hypothetical protein
MLQIYSNTAIGTAEDWMFSMYDGTTDTPIATVSAATPQRNWFNANLNYRVTAGNYIQFKTTTPAWVTNPEGIYSGWTIVIEYE